MVVIGVFSVHLERGKKSYKNLGNVVFSPMNNDLTNDIKH